MTQLLGESHYFVVHFEHQVKVPKGCKVLEVMIVGRLGVNFTNVFTQSFYAHRSQKPKKGCQLKQLFKLLGSKVIKAVSKHVDEIDPWLL